VKKANQTNTVAHVPATVTAFSSEVTKHMLASDIADTMRSVQTCDSYIRNERQRIAECTARIRSQLDTKREYETRIADYDWVPVEQKANEQLQRIAKYPFIESIDARGDDLLLTTKLIFTDVRTADDTRDTKRRCVGAFSIRINLLRGTVEVKNKLFPRMQYQHWSINSSGSPCWGDWQSDVNEYKRNGDIAGLVMMLLPYIRSTNDGSAYTRSHYWVRNRKRSLLANRVRKGAYVMAHEVIFTNNEYATNDYGETDYDDIIEEWSIPSGCKGIVLATQGNVAEVEWTEQISDPYGEDGDEGDGVRWYCDRYNLLPIKKAQYENSEVTSIDHVNTMSLDALDALPDGSTLADGQKLLGIKKTND